MITGYVVCSTAAATMDLSVLKNSANVLVLLTRHLGPNLMITYLGSVQQTFCDIGPSDPVYFLLKFTLT